MNIWKDKKNWEKKIEKWKLKLLFCFSNICKFGYDS